MRTVPSVKMTLALLVVFPFVAQLRAADATVTRITVPGMT